MRTPPNRSLVSPEHEFKPRSNGAFFMQLFYSGPLRQSQAVLSHFTRLLSASAAAGSNRNTNFVKKKKEMTTTLIIIGSIIALILIIALIIGTKLNIEASVVINRPKEQVFEYVKYVKNQDNFSVWNRMDPDMKKEYRGTDGQVGFVYAWDSSKNRNVGAGEQEIKMISDHSVAFELRFLRPMQDVAQSRITTEAVSPSETKVTWSFFSNMKFPMNIMKPAVKSMLGKSLQKSLTDLKILLEK
jgi:hypothetical protein